MSTLSLSAQNLGIRDGAAKQLVLRNTLYLTISQVLAMPLSVFTNAVAAHYLGAEAFGYAYLATTLCTFGFLAVGWGHDALLPAVIARDRSVAGEMFGSSLAWRVSTSVVVYAVLAFACYLLAYPAEFQWALGLTSLFTALTYFVMTGKDAIRGLERTDIPAYLHFGQQLLATVLVIVVLMLGGKLRAALVAYSVAGIIVFAVMWPTLGAAGIGSLSVRWATVKRLSREGTPFVVFSLAMVLQPNIDAVFLSKLAPVEVMGWYAVSRRLVGALILPATTLIGALYPTLCRLYATDRKSFNETTNSALFSVAILSIPVALGCALFPEIGVALFSRESFRPAEDNLRVMAFMVALVYFSMPLGSCILAAGKQKTWSLIQCLCVVVSLVLDPLLVPFFQGRTGNGGVGLGVASVISEALMIGFGIALVPRGVIDRRLTRLIGLTLVAGAAMAGAAFLAKPLTVFVAAPLSLAVYGVTLRLTGAIDDNQVARLMRVVGRRAARLVPGTHN